MSIGDNCEFGFVQRRAGVEDGGLLRWAVNPPMPLAHAISIGFSGIYEFKNLVPASARMVQDVASGLAFHSDMHSSEGVFDAPEEERRAIWESEFKKITYLSEKMNQLIEKGEKIFVYKRNSGVTDDELDALGAALRERGPGRLLYVENKSASNPGTVRYAGQNLYVGRIDRFAPYDQADKCSYQIWNEILVATLGLTGTRSGR